MGSLNLNKQQKINIKKRYGLIGYPLGHSFSKRYFEEKFSSEGIDALFENYPLKTIDEFDPLIAANPDLCGLAVTIPYKQQIITFLTTVDPASEEIGAVNCIRLAGKEKIGYNTDAKGFEGSFLPMLKEHHKKALVLGTGGSSKAVQYILQKNRIEFLTVSRNPHDQKGTISYEDIDEDLMWERTIIINCTPVGMTPDEESQPAIPYHLLTKDHLLYDLIYQPEKTKFLLQGEKRGCIVKNGFEMLERQAEENWRIWNEG